MKSMMLSRVLVLLMVGIAGVWAEPNVHQLKAASTIYTAKLGGEGVYTWNVRWNEDFGIADSVVLYSVTEWDETESSSKGKVLSIVGNLVSFSVESNGYSEGAAHPWHSRHFKTINAKTRGEVSLTDIFSEEEILQALLQDGVIQKRLNGRNPASLKELLEMDLGNCDFRLDGDALTGFAFHHVKNGQVAVRLGLTHGCEAARGSLTQLGFYLNIPSVLEKDLNNARHMGYLMSELSKLY
jgi:hypothetical protein